MATPSTMTKTLETFETSTLNREQYHILVVDDEMTLANTVKLRLDTHGFICTTATNGRAGMEFALEHKPHLIISDIRMPELDGVTMAEELKRERFDGHFIFMTGYTDYKSLSRAIRLRPLGFLQKPFGKDDLNTLADRAFSLHEQQLEQHNYNELLRRSVEEKTKELAFQTERLLTEKEMLNSIITSANFGLLALDTNGCVHLTNPMAATLLEFPQERAGLLIGSQLSSVLTDDVLAVVSDLYEQVTQDNQRVEIDWTAPESGNILDLVAYPLRFRDTMTGVVVIIHDQTEKNQLQRRLLHSAKLASIGELAAGVAHEINNPLGFVTSNCNTLKEYTTSMKDYLEAVRALILPHDPKAKATPLSTRIKELDEEYDIDYITEDLGGLMSESADGLRRVSKIVADLKSFARVDTDDWEQVDVNKIIENSLNLVRNELKYKMTVETDLATLPDVMAHPSQLAQVFTNLFINASHAVEKDGVLAVKTETTRNSVIVTVADNGSGIPENLLARIFDPFFTTKPEGKGTGMGLSISYGIVEKHGGTIAVESTIGKGTTFTLRLPIRQAATDSPEGQETQHD